jgi:transposase
MLRRLARVIDYAFVRDLVAPFYCGNNGRPSYDPVVIFKMLVLGRLYDLSDRRLCDEVAMHAGFRWFCGLGFEDDVPDHSTLTTTRDRWSAAEADVWRAALDRVVEACVGAGLVSGRHVSLDGTEIRANAAINSLERIPAPIPIAPPAVPATETSGTTVAPAPSPVTEKVAASAPSTEKGAPTPIAQARPGRRSGDEDFHGEKFSNATHRSATDPESMLFRKGRTKEAKLAYLGHVLIDTKSRVILGVDASPAHSAAERSVGLELLQGLASIPGLPRTRSAAADKGYGSGAFLASVAALGIEPHIPVPGSTVIEDLPTYSRAPRTLDHARARANARRDAEARNLARRLSKTRRARLSQRLRTRVEHVHAEAKQHHGLARARLRGLRKVRSEVRLVATVQNLKRLANRRSMRRGRTSAVAAIVIPRGAPMMLRSVSLLSTSQPRRTLRRLRESASDEGGSATRF